MKGLSGEEKGEGSGAAARTDLLSQAAFRWDSTFGKSITVSAALLK